MTLGAPLGLLALLALPVLVAAYFLRRKQPPRVVSALFLWRSPDQRAEAGPRLERFSREASLLLESLAILAMALFLADVQCGQPPARAHLVVVVDGSLSMNAVVDGASAADRVRELTARLTVETGAATLTVVESGPRPTVLAGPRQSVSAALDALERWRPVQPAHDLAAAFTLGRELAGPGAGVTFITDGPTDESLALPPWLAVRSVGRPAPNLALISAQRRDEAGTATVTVRVGNFTAAPADVPVDIDGDGLEPGRHPVTVTPGATAVVRATVPARGEVRVRLPADALALDGEVSLPPTTGGDLTLSLLPGLDGAAQAALERFAAAVPGVTLGPSGTTVGPPGSRARVEVGTTGAQRSFVGPFFTQKAHPLFDDVALGGVVWTAGASPPGQVLMAMGEVALVTVEDDGRLHLNLDVSRSNLQRTVAWPVLWGNVVRLARLDAVGLPRRVVMVGEDVPVVTSPGHTWALRGPEGQLRPVLGLGPVVLPPLPAPGRWELLEDGEVVSTLEVLPLDPRESDLRTRGPFEVPAAASAVSSTEAPLTERTATWLLLLAAVLLLLDFWLTARRPGPRTQVATP